MKYLIVMSVLFAFSAYANPGDESKSMTQETSATATEQNPNSVKQKKAADEKAPKDEKEESNQKTQ